MCIICIHLSFWFCLSRILVYNDCLFSTSSPVHPEKHRCGLAGAKNLRSRRSRRRNSEPWPDSAHSYCHAIDILTCLWMSVWWLEWRRNHWKRPKGDWKPSATHVNDDIPKFWNLMIKLLLLHWSRLCYQWLRSALDTNTILCEG